MRKRKFTEQEIEEICEYYQNNDTNLFILANKYHVRTKTISEILKNNNIILRKHNGLTQEQEEELCYDYKQGMHLLDVSKKYHMRKEKIKDILKKHDIKIRKRGDLLTTVLSDENINELCYEYQNGMSLEKICNKYHTKEIHINKILAEKNIYKRTKQDGSRNSFLTHENIKDLISDYMNDYQPVDYIINKYHISPKRFYKILNENNIQLRQQRMYCGQRITESFCLKLDENVDFQGKTLKDLINPESGHKLYPDVWMPKYKTMVEYDGIQHFAKAYGENSYEKIKKTDKIKEEYCQEHGYNMIRIDGRIFKTDKYKIQEYIIDKLLEFGYDIDIKIDN